MKRKKIPTLKEYLKWRIELSPLDQMNFDTLITLPRAEQIIQDLPTGKYRDMAIWGLALLQLKEKEKQ